MLVAKPSNSTVCDTYHREDSPLRYEYLRPHLASPRPSGGAREGMRTMLDALVPALAALHTAGGLKAATVAAAAGAEKTKTMNRWALFVVKEW